MGGGRSVTLFVWILCTGLSIGHRRDPALAIAIPCPYRSRYRHVFNGHLPPLHSTLHSSNMIQKNIIQIPWRTKTIARREVLSVRIFLVIWVTLIGSLWAGLGSGSDTPHRSHDRKLLTTAAWGPVPEKNLKFE